MVPIPKEPLEGIKVRLEAVIPIEVVDALETKVMNCGVLEVDVEILNPDPPEAVEFIVTCPVEPETVTLVPAIIEVTIPVKLVPEPLNDDAVIIPAAALIPDAFIVTPEPTTILVAVIIPVTKASPET